jgi:ATPase subunit of ABC transporter with duplicated ATPase domains
VDEPTAHLDRTSADALLDLLARQDRTVVLVTHSPETLDDRWRTVVLPAPR